MLRLSSATASIRTSLVFAISASISETWDISEEPFTTVRLDVVDTLSAAASNPLPPERSTQTNPIGPKHEPQHIPAAQHCRPGKESLEICNSSTHQPHRWLRQGCHSHWRKICAEWKIRLCESVAIWNSRADVFHVYSTIYSCTVLKPNLAP